MHQILAFVNLCFAGIICLLIEEDQKSLPLAADDKARFKSSFILAVKNSKQAKTTYRKRK